jgi:hypothetical protein
MTEHQLKFEELYKGKVITSTKKVTKNAYSYGYFIKWESDTSFIFQSTPSAHPRPLISISEETIDINKPDYGFIIVEPEEIYDFGSKWNKRMDELGAQRGTINDLLSI